MDYAISPINQQELVRLRRELHMYPELRWDLDRTSALVRRELDAAGIPYELIYGIAPYGCGLMIIFYLVSKYLPVFVKKYDYQIAPPPDPEMTEVTAE